MTEYVSLPVSCASCHTEQTVMAVLSTTEHGATDFDSRPATEKRGTMHTWAAMCKTCGYCSNDISKIEPAQKAFLYTQQYRQELNTPLSVRPIMANIFICASLLDEVKGDIISACWNALRAAWCCDDMENVMDNPYIYSPKQQSQSPFPQSHSPSENGSEMDTDTTVTINPSLPPPPLPPPDSKKQSVYMFGDLCPERDRHFYNYQHMASEMETLNEFIYDSNEEKEKEEKEEEWSLTSYFRNNCANRYDYEPYLFQLDRRHRHLFQNPSHTDQSKKCRIRAILLLERLHSVKRTRRNGEDTERLLSEEYVRNHNVPLISPLDNTIHFPKEEYICNKSQTIQYELWVQLVVDMLRRIEQFDVAGHLICDINYRGSDPYLRDILRFQLKLCKEKDSSCHNFAEVF